MSRARVVVTQAWQQISSGAVVITVDISRQKGAIYFNESADDNTAVRVYPLATEQFVQTETLPTFVRADELGFEIIVDGAL